MLAFIMSPLGKIAGVVLLLVALYAGFRLWLHDHDTQLLSGYVLQSEKTAAEARAAEMERQRNAAAQATEEHRKRLEAAQAQEQAAKDTLEDEIAKYERVLSQNNRSCTLSPDDKRWLLEH